MGKKLKIGDQITWNSEAGHVFGTIVKVHKKDFDYKSYTHHASKKIRNTRSKVIEQITLLYTKPAHFQKRLTKILA